MNKQVSDYLRECLAALGHLGEGDAEPVPKIRQIQQDWQDLWGGAVPSDERIFAAFICNKAGSHDPTDLWCFAENHCLVARNLAAAHTDLLIFPFRSGIKRMRIARNYSGRPQNGSKLAIAVWFQDDSKGVLDATDANCAPLENLLRDVLIPKLQS